MAIDRASFRKKLFRLDAYSYRADPTVPAFPDDKALIVFDGVCVFCSRLARFVAARDAAHQFRFAMAQSELGRALYRHAGLDPVNYESNLLIVDGRFFGKMDAFALTMARLGGLAGLFGVANRMPNGLSDWLYDRIARNRYRMFGRTETCAVPDASWRDRVIG